MDYDEGWVGGLAAIEGAADDIVQRLEQALETTLWRESLTVGLKNRD
jgi:hypothetical protein